MENLITTWIDVIDIIPQYFDFNQGKFNNITKAKIIKFIEDEESMIRSRLRSLYGNLTSINRARFYTLCLLNNNNPDFVINNSGISIISNFTQVYKFEFIQNGTSQTTVLCDITPDSGAKLVNQNITGSINLPNLTINPSAWNSNTFLAGDIIFLSVYHYESALAELVASSAAAKVLEQTANSQLASDGPSAISLRQKVTSFISNISEFSNPLEIGFKAQNLDPIKSNYNVDLYGVETTEYINE